MNGKDVYLFVMLALSAYTQARAQTAANVPGVFPNTNIVNSFYMGFAQGTCNDGTNTYWFGTAALQQKNAHYGPSNQAMNQAPAAGLTGFSLIHLGDPDYYQGYIYAPLEAGVGAPQGSVNIDIAIFTTPKLVRCAAISISNYQSEVSAVCIDPVLSNSVALFATSYVSTSANAGIYEYSVNNLTNLTFVKVLPLTQRIRYIQGIVCIGGMLYVIGDNGPAGEVYQVNPTNGVVVHLAELNVPGNTEWEGLDYYHGFLVANEGRTGTVYWFDFFGVLAANSMHRIAGSVNDGNNNPIAGVGVIASATINGTNQVMAADTDTNGNYSMSVPGGNWSVAVSCCCSNDSLNNLFGGGNYTCPNSQNVQIVYNDVTANFIVQICDGISITTPSSLPSGEAGVFYNQTLQAFSCNPIFAWTNTGGSLPSGLSLSSSGILSGKPAGSEGVFNFTVQVTDGNNATNNQSFSIGISNAVQITTTSLAGGTNITFYSAVLSAGDGQPSYTWSLSPGSNRLPPNLSLATNGVILGTPEGYGTFNFSVRVKDNLAGIADQPLVLNLAPANPPNPAVSVSGGQTPPLAISTIDGEIFVFWSASATNCVLQTTTDLASPKWVTVSDAVPGTTYNVTGSALQQYFRLQ